MSSISMTKAEYLEFRKQPDEEFNKNEILRAYYNHLMWPQDPIDTAEFFQAKYLMGMEEDWEGVLADMEEAYPNILSAFDVHFGVSFLVKNIGEERVLKGIY